MTATTRTRLARGLAAAALGVGMAVTTVAAPATASAPPPPPVAEAAAHAEAKAPQPNYLGVYSKFVNKTHDTVALAYVPDGTRTGHEDSVKFLHPGQETTYSRGYRSSDLPEIRVRVYEAVQHPSGDWHKGPMKQIITLSNQAWDNPRVEVQCGPYFDKHRQGLRNHSMWHDYKEGRCWNERGHGSHTWAKRYADSDDHKIFDVELHDLADATTQDYGNCDDR